MVVVMKVVDKYLLHFILFLFITLAVIDLIPFLCQKKFHFDQSTNPLHQAFHSTDYITSAVLVIGLSIPLLLDVFIDLSYISFNFLIPRIILITGCLFTHLIFYISVISLPSSSLDSVTLFVSLYRTREYFIAGSLVTFLLQASPSRYDKMITLLILITGIAYLGFLTWSNLSPHSSCLIPIVTGLHILVFCEYIGLFLWYLYLVCHKRTETLTSSSKKLTLIYLILVTLFLFGGGVIWYLCGAIAWGETGATQLIAFNLLEACVMLAAIILPARLTRLETHAREVCSLDTFASHSLCLSVSLSVSLSLSLSVSLSLSLSLSLTHSPVRSSC
jgi:hypothetical protein